MKHLLILAYCISTCWAQETNTQSTSPKETSIEKLFSALDPKDLPSALEAAQKAGVHPQIILEGHFLHLVDQENFSAIAKLVPELLKRKDQFNPDESEIFAVKEDWLSIVHYAQALQALEQNNLDSFKQHITEAFWLSPRQGQAFVPHINQLRMKQAMAKITLKPDLSMHPQDGSAATTLGKIMAHKKGAVLHFWNPMSQEVHQNLDDFIDTAQSCKKQNIAVISVLAGYNDLILKDAELLRKEDAPDADCIWAKDSNTRSLANRLRITDIPTMVVISPKGTILFNGHPSSDDFWTQLQTLAPELTRPKQTNKNPHDHVHSDG